MENKERNIFQRMLMIEQELGTVAKNLKVQASQTRSYEAVSERDILDSVKPLEIKYGVYSYPYQREAARIEDLLAADSKKVAIRVTTVYRFVNVDKPDEYIDMISYGDGVDTLDKAPGKAMTYADKYALMKAYKISTGDDPDEKASPEKAEIRFATKEQEDMLKSLLTEERFANMLKASGVESVLQMTFVTADNYIKKLQEKAKSKEPEKE